MLKLTNFKNENSYIVRSVEINEYMHYNID